MSSTVTRVGIVTDSTSDIPKQLARTLGIEIVPCQVYIGQEALRDNIDLSPAEFFDRIRQRGVFPRTTQPPIAEFVRAYQLLLEEAEVESIVAVVVAGTLSGTVNGAWAAAQTLPDPGRVTVIDSGQLSMGLGWAAISAARCAQAGGSRVEVVNHVHNVLPRLRVAAMVETLDNLRHGGRISAITAVLGTALKIKPLLSVQEGQVHVWGRARTRVRALQLLAERVESWGALEEMAVLHTGAEEVAAGLAAQLGDPVPRESIIFVPAGSALTSHLGLGAVGVCALRREGG